MRVREKTILAVKGKTVHMAQEFDNIDLMILTNLLLCSSHVHSVVDSATLTPIESCPSAEAESAVQVRQEEPEKTSTDVLPEMGPQSFEEQKKMLQEIVQKDFRELTKGKNSSIKYQAMYEGTQVMVDVEKTVPLFEDPCGKKSCEEKNEVVEQKLEAGVLTVTYQCKNGHRDV